MKQIFSLNGVIKPIAEAIIPADQIEAMYGFGVYETLKVRSGIVYFVSEHVDRLFHSAECIALQHRFSTGEVERFIHSLMTAISEDALNIKMLLMGGATPEDSQLYIFPLAPFFPKRTWYKEGISVCSYVYERWMPQSKSLNMLPSYYYFTHAKQEGHYDALLVDSNTNIREGTRTNFYVMKGKNIYSPPKEDVLEGVTMMSLERAVAKSDFKISYKKIPYVSLNKYDAAFLSSTSTKIIPICEIDGNTIPISNELKELIQLYNQVLDASKGRMENI